MSKTIERAIQDVAHSTFTYDERKRKLTIENAVILWPNFSGEPDRFGNSARTFNVAINGEFAEVLSDLGFRIRVVEDKDEDDNVKNTLFILNVKVNMATDYPPTVCLFTEYGGKKRKQTLNESTIGLCDKIDIASADCIINAYQSKRYPDKTTGYLDRLYIRQETQLYFGGKYDDWGDVDDDADGDEDAED